VFIAVSSAPLVDIVGLLCGEQSLQVRGLVDRRSPVNCGAKIKAARRLRVRLGFPARRFQNSSPDERIRDLVALQIP
jgi:hypothetical protein